MERKILDLFLFSSKLKFSEIEKLVNIRSNKLAYHIKQLAAKNILKKEGEYYSLSDASEYLIPYLSEKKAQLGHMQAVSKTLTSLRVRFLSNPS
jgi:predicted transcriptional regulator